MGKQDGMWFTAITFELRVGGLSAATTMAREIGQAVNLSAVVGKRVDAVARRKQGALYGFEFVGATPKIVEQIEKRGKGPPLFKSMIDV
jgi:hypothetical protein